MSAPDELTAQIDCARARLLVAQDGDPGFDTERAAIDTFSPPRH